MLGANNPRQPAGAIVAGASTVVAFGALRASPLLRLAIAPSKIQQLAAASLAGGLTGCLGSLISIQYVMGEVRRMPHAPADVAAN